jgi:hypothetical protein
MPYTLNLGEPTTFIVLVIIKNDDRVDHGNDDDDDDDDDGGAKCGPCRSSSQCSMGHMLAWLQALVAARTIRATSPKPILMMQHDAMHEPDDDDDNDDM